MIKRMAICMLIKSVHEERNTQLSKKIEDRKVSMVEMREREIEH